MIEIIQSIQKKGILETGVYCFQGIYNIFLSRMRIFWLRARGYDIDYSVTMGGRNIFIQSTKNSIKVDKKSALSLNVKIATGFGGKIIIHRNVAVFEYCVIDAHRKIEIGENTLIAPFCCLTDYDHLVTAKDESPIVQGYKSAPISIGRNVWLGTKVIILKGGTIGDNTVIGAGSVVTRDIPSNSVAVGNPARVIKKIS